MEDDKNNKEIEKISAIKVVNGDVKNLNISDVYEHIKIEEPEDEENVKKEIVIPKKTK